MQQRKLIDTRGPRRVSSAAFRQRKRMRLMIAALGAALAASVIARA